MSSDNYWLITKKNGQFYMTMEFASDESGREINLDGLTPFDSLEAAMNAANEEYTEYGVSYVDLDE